MGECSQFESMAFEFNDVMSLLFVLSVGVAVGTAMTMSELLESAKNWRPLCIGVAAQFLFMPFMAWLMTHILPLEDAAENSVSALFFGAALVGCMPGGTTSNLVTWFVGGNVPLSVVMSLVSNVAAFGMTPLCLFLTYQTRFSDSDSAEIPYVQIAMTLAIILSGIASGMVIRAYGEFVCCREKQLHEIVASGCAIFSVIFLVFALVAGVVKHHELLSCGWQIWVYVSLIQPLGYAGGLLFAYVAQENVADMKTISIETGIQSFALAMAIVTLSLDEDDPKFVDTYRIPVLCALLYSVHCAWIVVLFRLFPSTPTDSAAPSEKCPESPEITFADQMADEATDQMADKATDQIADKEME